MTSGRQEEESLGSPSVTQRQKPHQDSVEGRWLSFGQYGEDFFLERDEIIHMVLYKQCRHAVQFRSRVS
jgi:hypothetical protein